jgi:hypothetical protein
MSPTIASCYCGATRIELPTPPEHATQCTCSWCTKSGGLWAYYGLDEVRILSAEHLGRYAPNGINEHFFCQKCGCTTHGTAPNWTEESITTHEMPKDRKFAINVKILDDYALMVALPVEVIDGRNLW